MEQSNRPKAEIDGVDQKRTTTERVYEELKLMAMTYRFRPGERINEVLLAEHLNVSRTPLREALNRLSSEGFLSISPHRGFIGRLLDAKEISQLFELRSILEQAIVRLACERATDEELAGIKRFAEERDARWSDRVTLENLRDDEEFHLRIARTTGNTELVKALEQVNARIHFVRWIDLRLRPPAKHRHSGDFVDMLLARDGEGCAQRLGKMIARRHEEIVEVIRTGIADIYVGTP